MSTKKARRIVVRYASELLRGKAERSRAKRDLRLGREPWPKYATGKFWND